MQSQLFANQPSPMGPPLQQPPQQLPFMPGQLPPQPQLGGAFPFGPGPPAGSVPRNEGSRQRAGTADANGRRSRGRRPGEPKRTYAICGGCKGCKWHDLIDSAKCTCGRRWPNADIVQCARQTHSRALAAGEDPPDWTFPYMARSPADKSGAGSARGSRGGGGANSGSATPKSASAAADGPSLATHLAALQQASAAGLVQTADGSPFNLPDTLVFTAPAAPAPAPEPVSKKDRKAAAERDCQQTQKAQRIALQAVQAAETDVESMRNKLQAKECLLEEARKQLAAATKAADAAIVEFNEASRAFQEEIAAMAAPAPSSPAGKGNASSRASSAGGGQKRPSPDEPSQITAIWDALRANCQEALAAGDEAAFRAAAARSLQELLDARAATADPKDVVGDGPTATDVGGNGGLPDASDAAARAAAAQLDATNANGGASLPAANGVGATGADVIAPPARRKPRTDGTATPPAATEGEDEDDDIPDLDPDKAAK